VSLDQAGRDAYHEAGTLGIPLKRRSDTVYLLRPDRGRLRELAIGGAILICPRLGLRGLGTRRVSTPSSKVAVALSASRPSGRVSVRLNGPRRISWIRVEPSSSLRAERVSPAIVRVFALDGDVDLFRL